MNMIQTTTLSDGTIVPIIPATGIITPLNPKIFLFLILGGLLFITMRKR